MPVQLPGFDMKKSQIFVKRVWQGVFALITICFLWCFINLSILAFSWLKSYSMTVDNTPQTYYADIRNDKGQVGKTLIISAIKAQPDKKVWFGHIWVVWDKAPPHAHGEKEAGFYAASKSQAARALILSIISPSALITGQKPIAGVMRNDEGLYRHWQLVLRVDNAQYARALLVDDKWRNQNQYLLRPSISGKTITCRDYVFEVAQAVGLKVKQNDWDKFPPESFAELVKLNNIETPNRVYSYLAMHNP